ncbi:sugar ABC transporter permease [Bacillaceae bacterium SIJ1]|nr:sugar ABC transporter permease [Litoribacterium kuwaitense]
MMIPILGYFAIFSFYPLIRGFAMSMTEFKLMGGGDFIWFENYLAVWKDPVFVNAMLNTAIIGTGILIGGFVAPLILAISLNEVASAWMKKSIQTIVYLPHLFSWVVVGGIWIYMLSPDGGTVNGLLNLFGIDSVPFLTETTLAKPIMVLTAIWKDMGFICIIFLAAIVGISPTLYEAAKMDGATRLQQIFYITLPQLAPTMKVVFLLNMMGFLKIFDQIFVMTNPAIARHVDVIMMYTYEKGILQFQMGIATAAAFTVIFVTLILVMIFRKVVRYDVG